jgi:hypothetical protein
LGVSAATADEFSENPRDIYQVVLNEIDRLLITVENIQHTEFVAYFKCFGISHSDYCREKYATAAHSLEGDFAKVLQESERTI